MEHIIIGTDSEFKASASVIGTLCLGEVIVIYSAEYSTFDLTIAKFLRKAHLFCHRTQRAKRESRSVQLCLRGEDKK